MDSPAPAPLLAALPGVLASAAALAVALAVHAAVPAVSAAVVAVVLGAALAGFGGARGRLAPGLRFVSRPVLRTAVVLLGLQVSVPQVLELGWRTVTIVVVTTGATFALTLVAGRRLGVPPGASLLVATGVSVCGAAAVAAMHDSAGTEDDEAAAALAVVVLYGTGALLAVPLAASWLGLSPLQLAVWTGASVHEVAQVAAIGAATGVLTTAVAVKLGRVVLLAPLVALVAYARRPVPARAVAAAGPAPAPAARAARPGGVRPVGVPLFVCGFVAMAGLRATGVVPDAVTAVAGQAAAILLAAAMFGLGAGIDLRRLLRGGRAVLLGGVATGLVAGVSLAGVLLLL
ncbi:putative sulfate exporter family transporter [Nonomuraea sp. MCN248]|uniref:Sulfate exporter family transporter n=1 Tax=Nonomuraea corallina TaxID=2989783 RepID=A0ABT4SFS7_9ACTN|nr:putative sulfate exporter family transporter [Nonomuraea corallina]MDA0636052.1 putative sulfate exporter family transporter [Nonomuraea corallina]